VSCAQRKRTGGDGAGVDGVDDDVGALQAKSELVGERHHGQL
jgi:hypothetical protein